MSAPTICPQCSELLNQRDRAALNVISLAEQNAILIKRAISAETALTAAEKERDEARATLADALKIQGAQFLRAESAEKRIGELEGELAHWKHCHGVTADVLTAAESRLSALQSVVEQKDGALRDARALENLGYNLCYAENCGGKDETGVTVETYRKALSKLHAKLKAALLLSPDAAGEQADQSGIAQDDLAAVLLAAGLSDHARPCSPHDVVQNELLPHLSSIRVALNQASFCLRELLPDHPDAQLTVRMVDRTLKQTKVDSSIAAFGEQADTTRDAVIEDCAKAVRSLRKWDVMAGRDTRGATIEHCAKAVEALKSTHPDQSPAKHGEA